MKKTALFGAALVAALSCSPAAAKIPFNGQPVANAPLPRIGNYKTPNTKQLYVEASRGKWYRADLAEACPGLMHANKIQIKMTPKKMLNSSSIVMVRGQACPVASVARVRGPVGRNKVMRFESTF